MASLMRWMIGLGGTGDAEEGERDVPKESPSEVQEWKTLIRFDGFLSLPPTERYHVTSTEFACFGRQWMLRLHPNGEENSGDGMVALYLVHLSEESLRVQFSFCIRNSFGQNIGLVHLRPDEELDAEGFWGSRNFIKRSVAVASLVEGALAIEVRMKRIADVDPKGEIFIPQNPMCKNIHNKFMDENSADVVFEVGGGTAVSPAIFHANSFILKDCSQTLSDLCKLGRNINEPIEIADVKPGIFRHVLYYIYGGKVADEDLKTYSKEIIEAADKYGIVNLKLEAEACLVKSTTISTENMIDHLLYADAKNCALLKEAVMDFIIENGIEVAERVSLKGVSSDLFEDLLAAVNRGKKSDANSKEGEGTFGTMRISDLRRKLDERGLDIDGSRESLVAALEEHSGRCANDG